MFARSAPVGVILRRGPSKQVRLIKWRTDSDEFERAQWFKGRVYLDSSDLSPDGSHLIYFAAKHKQPLCRWTAISKPPYFTALALWPQNQSAGGGGWFEADRCVRLWHSPRELPTVEGKLPANWVVRSRQTADLCGHRSNSLTPAECDNWSIAARPGIHVKEGKDGQRLEARVSRSGRNQVAEYTIRLSVEDEWQLPAADWADIDQQGRVVFARGGKLSSARIDACGELVEQGLADFTDDVFEPIQTPPWAQLW